MNVPKSPDNLSYDTFISHASADKEKADLIVAALEEHNVRCWIAPRDIQPGIEYGSGIINGIKNSKTLVVLLSEVSVTSRHVRTEVERAVALGLTVYPVRLEDVELGEALEFFLSIQQRIDVFSDPSGRNLKILAHAITSDAAPEHVARKASQPSWFKKAIPTVTAGGVLLTIALTYQYFSTEMAMNQAHEQIQYDQNEAKKQLDLLAKKSAPKLDKLKFIVTPWGNQIFQVMVDGTDANVNRYDSRSYFVVDGKQETGGSGSFKTNGSFDHAEFVVEEINGGIVARRDITEDVHKVLGKSVSDAISDELNNNDNWNCSIGGCQFLNGNNISMCSPMIKEISARIDEGSSWQSLPKKCDDLDTTSSLCYNFDDFPFNLDPDKPIQFQITLGSGKSYTHSIVQTPDALRYTLDDHQIKNPSFDHWVKLVPINNKNPSGPAPIALLAYQPDRFTIGGFRLVSGLQGCKGQGKNHVADNGWLVDQDGKGLIRLGRQLSFGPVNRQPNAEEAKQLVSGKRQIAISADMEDGERKGPYWYQVDPRDAIRLAALRDKPEVKCEMDPYAYKGQWVCVPKSNIGWIGAKQIEFGSVGDNLSSTIDINFTVENFMTQKCSHNQMDCKPFIFQIPDNWDNVFYRVTGRNGKTYSTERVIVSGS